MFQVPKIINLPEKMMSIVENINDYRYFLAAGGRGSSKTQSFGRIILYLTSIKKLRVVCGRETQATISESVYTLLTDLIKEYSLDYNITQAKITHNKTGSEITFKGFREQGAVNIKGLEGADIIWCFPSGVKVDGRDISDIKVGDFVTSFNHKKNKTEKKKVLKVYKREYKNEYYLLTFKGGKHIISTDNHPFYIKGFGYVRADGVKEGDILYAREESLSSKLSLFGRLWGCFACGHKGKKSKLRQKRWLFVQGLCCGEKKGKYVKSEPYDKSRKCSENKRFKIKRWKWLWLYRTAKAFMGSFGSWLVGGVVYTNWLLQKARKLSNLLQGGFSKYILRSCNRDRWRLSQDSINKRERCEENFILREQRVESIKVLKQADIKRLGYGCEGNYVYNIEVEGNNNYFANSVLVHNCDEAEAVTKHTLDILIPTLRKPNSIFLFSMNRKHRNDPVYEFCANRDNAYIVNINYYDNPYCPKELLDEANECKRLNEQDYNHIWLGMPLDLSDDCLFSVKKLDECKNVYPSDDGHLEQRVIGIDFAAMGGDMCVASVLKRIGLTKWVLESQEAWNYTEPSESIGRIINILGKYQYDVAVLDVGGMGTVVYSLLREAGIDIKKFDGASTKGIPQEYHNSRAFGYYMLKNMIDNCEFRCNNFDTLRELEGIRFKYASSGKRLIVSKEEMRKQKLKSPDRADSVMMSVYAIRLLLGKTSKNSDIKIKTTKRWG